MKRFVSLIVAALVLVTLMPSVAQEGVTLTVVTYSSFAVSEDVLAQFEEESGITLRILRLPDTGAVVNQSILSRNNPLGDVLYGVDNTFLSRALNEDLFVPYESPLITMVPEIFQLDGEEFRVTPVQYGDVCLNYDVSYFEANDLPVPASLEDLIDPVYRDLLVVQNPAASSPGLAFLVATVAVFGEEGDYTYLDYWTDLVENGVLVVDGWSEAYYGEFTVSGDGDRPLVVSYASSPPAEVLFAPEETEEAPTGAIVADDTCFRQIEFVGILQGTENLEAAQAFVDFTLSLDFQEDLPLQMFVFPVNEEAELPDVFAEFAEIPDSPVEIELDDIEERREAWIQAWTEVVLR
jgi:thiamine transport system substrate-binding protein